MGGVGGVGRGWFEGVGNDGEIRGFGWWGRGVEKGGPPYIFSPRGAGQVDCWDTLAIFSMRE